MAIVTRQDDPRWSDFVNWVLQGLLTAEEDSFSQSTASSFSKTDVFGAGFEDLFVNALGAVGNYGEMYARNLESIIPASQST